MSLTMKTLLPKLSQKTMKTHLSLEKPSAPVGGSVTKNSGYQREQYDRAASDIERILDNMAEKAACEELESERIRELNEAAQSISYGNIHSGKQTGLIMGRRLDAHALCRNDGKVFYKNNLPNEIPELAVGLLLDESGSMCSCDRCTYARAAAIILYDFCESLEIPVMVYGHSTDYYDGKDSVELYSYAEFNGFDNDQPATLPIPVTTARPPRRICEGSSRNINAKAYSLLPPQSATISRILRGSTEIPSSILLT